MANGPGFGAVDVFLQARACLNDQAAETYPNANLLVWLQMAWEDLDLEFAVNDCPIALAKAVIAVPAGTLSVSYITTPALPSDMWMPIALAESETGKNVWVPMRQRLFEQPVSAADRPSGLTIWTWHEGTIFFEGAQNARDVLIYFFKATPEIGVADTNVGRVMPFSRGFLSRKVAALAYALQKKDLETAQVMQDEAVNFKDRIIAILVKQNQNMPMRRRAYMGGRFMRTRMRMG